MATHDKTIRLARLIGLEHKTVDARVVATRAVARTDGSVEWRWYPWRPYERAADLVPIRCWLDGRYPDWRWDYSQSSVNGDSPDVLHSPICAGGIVSEHYRA